MVRLGLERLIDGPDRRLIDGRRIGLVCNPASVDSRLRHASDRLSEGDWTLAALFGPQHGFRSDVQENMIESPHGEDARRRVPVFSLYSETREPTREMLADIDVLVIDLQDVG
ncbi:MAG: exo-beta-N-acetylmuramidase NamZ domain-containing protein, partial [Vicinamibacterales bacterium]